ncbi:IS1 family transposase, partial [Shigella flexneri]|nr:IS1 family transposase [Shigella flexneri]
MASISIRCPSCSATEGVVRNGKSTAGHQRYLCSHCRKTWQLQFTYTVNRPGFPGECFICELRLPDHRFRWKHNKLFLLL